jgi:hypothetical protein
MTLSGPLYGFHIRELLIAGRWLLFLVTAIKSDLY